MEICCSSTHEYMVHMWFFTGRWAKPSASRICKETCALFVKSVYTVVYSRLIMLTMSYYAHYMILYVSMLTISPHVQWDVSILSVLLASRSKTPEDPSISWGSTSWFLGASHHGNAQGTTGSYPQSWNGKLITWNLPIMTSTKLNSNVSTHIMKNILNM